MDNLKPQSDALAWQLEIAALQENFTLSNSPTEMSQLMSQYELTSTEIMGDYAINTVVLSAYANTKPVNKADTGVIDLAAVSVIQEWPMQINWSRFNQAILQLQYAWLQDYQAGLSLDTAFLLARSLTLASYNATENSTRLRFQCFLMHILASATHQFDQHQSRYKYFFDLETGLPNQQLFLSSLEQFAQLDNALVGMSKPNLGILMIDLNIHFEEVSHLRIMSSDIVQAAVSVIRENLNEEASLFRTSTHELTIIVTDLKFSAQLNLIASKLAHAFDTELPLSNITLILKPYFGGISSLETQINIQSLLDGAKLALQHAMVNNHQIEIYDKLISSALLNEHHVDEAIIEAFQENELALYLQPLISLKHAMPNSDMLQSEHCESVELLLRWPNAQWPSLSPVRLIDTIYKKGFANLFVRWLVNNACRLSAELMALHQRRFSLTINLCSTDLLDGDLPELLTQSIALWDVPAENLIIEITETDLSVNEEHVAKVLDKIVLLGFKLALDDFGTGYSSMARLRNMPVHLIKIDQSFVSNIAKSTKDRQIVQSILKLAHSLGKEVVAEGVEDVHCLNMLKAMRCNKIQGYYYAKPMPFDAFMPWLSEFETSRSHADVLSTSDL